MENTNGLLATYAKRKNRIMKKAAELAILCGVYIILLMFSPSGKPSLCRGKHKYFCVIYLWHNHYKCNLDFSL